MVILFDNLVIGATITSENASNNYPPANLQDTSLIKRLQSSLDWDTATLILEEISTISDIFYGYTSATYLRFRFYDYENILLQTIEITNPESWSGHISFASIDNVYMVEMYYRGDLDVYIGGLGLGVAFTMQDPISSWKETPTDNSVFGKSPHGQSNQDYIAPLRKYPFEFPATLNREEINEIEVLFNSLGVGFPFWIDITEDNHDFMPPLYCTLIETPIFSKVDFDTFSFSFLIEEAR